MAWQYVNEGWGVGRSGARCERDERPNCPVASSRASDAPAPRLSLDRLRRRGRRVRSGTGGDRGRAKAQSAAWLAARSPVRVPPCRRLRPLRDATRCGAGTAASRRLRAAIRVVGPPEGV
jgi:hypothetical protein